MQSPALQPRKAPKQARARATRDAILEAAAQLIARHGLSAFTTNAVAIRAGVSIGSLYQYFPNKDALMAALIRRQQDRQAATLAAAVEGVAGDDLGAAVRSLVRAAMQHHRDDSLLATAIDHEEARLPIAAELDARLDMGGEMVRGALIHFRDQLGPVDIDAAVHSLPVLVRAIVDAWANRSPPQLNRAEGEAVRAVLGYLTLGAAGPSRRAGRAGAAPATAMPPARRR